MDPLHRRSRSRLRGRLGRARSRSRGGGNSWRRRGRATSTCTSATLCDRNACCECEEAGEYECDGETAIHNRQTLTEAGRSSRHSSLSAFGLLSGIAHSRYGRAAQGHAVADRNRKPSAAHEKVARHRCSLHARAAFFAGFQTSSGSRSPERNVSVPALSSTYSVFLNA